MSKYHWNDKRTNSGNLLHNNGIKSLRNRSTRKTAVERRKTFDSDKRNFQPVIKSGVRWTRRRPSL